MTSPYRSLPSEVNTANEVTRQLLAATADHPELLPVYISLTSGEPPPETKHVLDTEGGVRHCCGERSRHARRSHRWPAGSADVGSGSRQVRGGVGGPPLAAERTTYGLDPGVAPEPPTTRAIQRSVLSEIDSLEVLGAAGLPDRANDPRRDRRWPSPRPRSSAIPSC